MGMGGGGYIVQGPGGQSMLVPSMGQAGGGGLQLMQGGGAAAAAAGGGGGYIVQGPGGQSYLVQSPPGASAGGWMLGGGMPPGASMQAGMQPGMSAGTQFMMTYPGLAGQQPAGIDYSAYGLAAAGANPYGVPMGSSIYGEFLCF